ncbi:GNAT family N-acetyltransferase [Streptomyces sp. NPDC054933]
MTMRPATSADVPDLMRLRIEAEGWLAEAGIDQWRSPGFRERALAKWQNDIAEGRTWIAAAEEAVGTVTLACPDLDFWKPFDVPEDAVYVAKLITARQAAGQQLGGRILDWVGAVARHRGLPWVRLDCDRANTKLQDYYLREGFRNVRTEAPAHRLSGWMAQRPSGVVRHPEAQLQSLDAPVDTPQRIR